MPKVKRSQVAEPVAPTKGRPDWIVVALALLGVGVAGYLTALKFGANQAFLCRDGSGCDIVQASRYAILIFALMMSTITSPRRVRQMTWIMIIASGYIASRAVFDYVRGVNLVEGDRVRGAVGGMFENPNDLALNLVTFLAPSPSRNSAAAPTSSARSPTMTACAASAPVTLSAAMTRSALLQPRSVSSGP